MEFRTFESIIQLLKDHSKKTSDLYTLGIDLIQYAEPLEIVISHLIGTIYGQEGKEWFEWWCYDKNWGENKELTAHDEHGNRICETIEEIWKYLEEIKVADYTLPKELTTEERLNIIKTIFE